MKTVLAYGDSITWGTDPARTGLRHAFADRWPNVLQARLGGGVQVVAEGLGGRTTAHDDILADCDRNGARILPTILMTHRPVHIAIIMLGTNDMKPAVAGSASAAFLGMKRCVEIVQKHSPRVPGFAGTKVVVVSPPLIVPTKDPFFADMVAGGVENSKKLAPFYEALAAEMGCAFFDAASVATASEIDGVHLDAANTRAIGEALAPKVGELLKD